MPCGARRDRPSDLEVNKILRPEGANHNLVGFVMPGASDEMVFGEVSNGDDVHRRAAGLLLDESS
jgi:hypothetical protein